MPSRKKSKHLIFRELLETYTGPARELLELLESNPTAKYVTISARMVRRLAELLEKGQEAIDRSQIEWPHGHPSHRRTLEILCAKDLSQIPGKELLRVYVKQMVGLGNTGIEYLERFERELLRRLGLANSIDLSAKKRKKKNEKEKPRQAQVIRLIPT